MKIETKLDIGQEVWVIAYESVKKEPKICPCCENKEGFWEYIRTPSGRRITEVLISESSNRNPKIIYGFGITPPSTFEDHIYLTQKAAQAKCDELDKDA